MLKPVANGVHIHQSQSIQSNTVVVASPAGVLLIDPGLTDAEMACLANDLSQAGQSVLAGFSTHPHWDHLLWHPRLGEVPRYGTARNAAEAADFLADPDWRTNIVPLLLPDIAGQVPLDLIGHITALPAATAYLPWDGPQVRLIEHQAHAAGHAALLVEESGVLVAGDMLSDVFIPLLNFEAADPIGDYLAALQLFETVAGDVTVFIPGHGSVGHADQLLARINQDRLYVEALRDGTVANDPRLGPSAPYSWVAGVHERQLQQLARKKRP